MMNIFSVVIVLLFSFPTFAVKTESNISPPLVPAQKKLWSQWYVYTAGNQPFGYYKEDLELSTAEKQFNIQQQLWEKNESGGISETFLGAVAKDDKKLSPVAFYVEKKKSSGGTVIQGRIKNGELQLSVIGLGGKIEPVKQNVFITNNTFLSSYLPMFLMKQKTIGKAISYKIILEEGDEGNFLPQNGTATISKTISIIEGNACQQVRIKFKKLDSTWWIDKEGK